MHGLVMLTYIATVAYFGLVPPITIVPHLMLGVCPILCEAWFKLHLQREALSVHDVPVKNIHLRVAQAVQHLLQLGHRDKVPGGVQ